MTATTTCAATKAAIIRLILSWNNTILKNKLLMRNIKRRWKRQQRQKWRKQIYQTTTVRKGSHEAAWNNSNYRNVYNMDLLNQKYLIYSLFILLIVVFRSIVASLHRCIVICVFLVLIDNNVKTWINKSTTTTRTATELNEYY